MSITIGIYKRAVSAETRAVSGGNRVKTIIIHRHEHGQDTPVLLIVLSIHNMKNR